MCTMDFMKGVGLGIIVGSAIGMTMTPSRKTKNMMGKWMRSAGSVIDEITDAMGW